MWETEKAKEAEKISDLVKARELLLDSKGRKISKGNVIVITQLNLSKCAIHYYDLKWNTHKTFMGSFICTICFSVSTTYFIKKGAVLLTVIRKI